MARKTATAEVVGPKGRKPFGDFMRERRQALGITVVALATASGISRQNYYLLEANKQRPKLETAVLVLRALGLEPSAPVSGMADLEFEIDGQPHKLFIRWSSDREKAKALAAGAGLAGVFTASAAGAAGLPIVGMPIAGPALALYFLHRYRDASRVAGVETSKYELLAEFMREAEEAEPEDLEAVLYVLKSMRAESPGGDRGPGQSPQ